MNTTENYLSANREAWNQKTAVHFDSEFYNNEAFIAGKTSLNSIELGLLGDLTGKSVLHLQCHFGQDTLSMNRMGATVTGVDLSDAAIKKADELAAKTNLEGRFICSDVYDLPNHLDEQFDVVFTSYGTIGWLPDLSKWANIIDRFLKPDGKFVFAEFHPVVWMFDYEFKTVQYNYFNRETIIEEEEGTYTDPTSNIKHTTYSWNHDLAEVLSSLINVGLTIDQFQEFDYSPYNCFKNTEEFEPGKFRIQHLKNRIPMVYALSASKK